MSCQILVQNIKHIFRRSSDDLDSHIDVSIEVTPNSLRSIEANNGQTAPIYILAPADTSYCGTVFATFFVHSSDRDDDNLERNKENQIGMDKVTLQCDPTGEGDELTILSKINNN